MTGRLVHRPPKQRHNRVKISEIYCPSHTLPHLKNWKIILPIVQAKAFTLCLSLKQHFKPSDLIGTPFSAIQNLTNSHLSIVANLV